MSAHQGAPVILRYEQEAERDAFVTAFAGSFDLLACNNDPDAISVLARSSGTPPALVIITAQPDRILHSALLDAAAKAGCFRILITDNLALDHVIQLLDDQEIDRCYTQPWDSNRLRSDLFTATMAVNARQWPKPGNAVSDDPLILIVDDEIAATKYLGKHLLRLQDRFGVRSAASADEALEILAREGDRIAAIMTDQRMPGMKGVQLVTELQQSHPFITRILTSAYGELDVALGAVNDGRIFRYEKKPWKATDLLPVLNQAIDRHFQLKAAGEALHDETSAAFEADRKSRQARLQDALSAPAPQALGSSEVINRFLSDLESIHTLTPGTGHRRASEPEALIQPIIRGLRAEVSACMLPEQGSQILGGQPVPSGIADALDVLLAASGQSRSFLKVSRSGGRITISADPDQPLRMYSHLLSPLARVSKPLIQQQGALLSLYLWADRLGGSIRLTGGQQSFTLTLSFPAFAIDSNGAGGPSE